ncbi:nicotinate phosphoribosyltransferase [Parachlamydia sp. AcF125]|uniref:nicotinate phosphoribosyltransferase n=1 Tax=Parachlamydia sp. AcF125 TaxID=2795736 RepID=UPI001BC9C87B|nr:nicotinate phosphoribosyltransferase [Parachlamydia sp. AcF125]MBS4169287.1 Nicotinate phosphoribosyltransferase pncB2 [Parachlamydia sp. AcF125]
MKTDTSSRHIYNQSMSLLTDLYQLTMGYGYWKAGLDNKEAVFHLFFRRPPFQGGFTIAAGLAYVIDYLANFHFDSSDLQYLASLKNPDDGPLFEEKFFDYLATLRFNCSLDAVPEGTVVFPYEPLIRVQGPLIMCQLLEGPLLNLINFSSLIATKAARMCIAAEGEPVLEFGLRRAQGVDGALTASRAAYIGGCESTSNLLAGKLFGIPVKGTHSHSWVMAFGDELEAFQTYARCLPGNCVFLVDTYDSIEGVKKAIEVGKWLRAQGKKLLGIRLDSGDLAYLSILSRRLLDEAGFTETPIFASNELDETVIAELKRQGAQISVWGVGTNLVTAKGQPALDGVYKLSAIRDPGKNWDYKLKLSEQMMKVSNPGILQVRRYSKAQENMADVIYDIHSDMSKKCYMIDPFDPTRQRILSPNLPYEDLLIPIFQEGKQVYESPSLGEIRKRTQSQLLKFPVGVKRFLNPHQYAVGMEKTLYEKKVHLIQTIRSAMSRDFLISADEKNSHSNGAP